MTSDELTQIRAKVETAVTRRPRQWASILGPLVLGGALVVLYRFYGETLAAPWPRLHQILFERGPIPHITVWFALLALGDIIWKLFSGWWVERAGTRALRLRGEGTISVSDLAKWADQIEQFSRARFSPKRHSVWVHRLSVGLMQFARNDTKENVREALHSQADVDEASMVSRYLAVKILIWALPLLGFIGTVQGIGDGIGEFAQSLKNPQLIAEAQATPGQTAAPQKDPMEEMKDRLGKVTSGLGIAFDTTYLALVLTVALMLLLTGVEKIEGDRLTRFAELCETTFVGRLPTTNGPGSDVTREDFAQLGLLLAEFQDTVRTAAAAAEKVGGTQLAVEDLTRAVTEGISCKVSIQRGNKTGS